MVLVPSERLVMAFPDEDAHTCPRRELAERAILGGMLLGIEKFIHAGANTDWTHPMWEMIARACVEAWEQWGWDSDDQWKLVVGERIAHYTGRHPATDEEAAIWLGYLVRYYGLQFYKEGKEQQA